MGCARVRVCVGVRAVANRCVWVEKLPGGQKLVKHVQRDRGCGVCVCVCVCVCVTGDTQKHILNKVIVNN